MSFATGRVTDTLLTVVTAGLVVLGVASTQAVSPDLAPVSAAVEVAPAVVTPEAPASSSRTAPVVDPAVAAPVTAVPVSAVPVAAVPVPRAPTVAAAAARVDSPSQCSGPGWQQRRGETALGSLRPAPAPGYPVTFKPSVAGFYGLTKPAQHVIDVYVRGCATESDALLRHVVAHEIGHAWDKTALTDAQRGAWLAARRIPAGTPWQGCNRCTDFATPAGDFAEVYAQWRRGATDNRSKLGGAPAPAALDRLAREFFGA